MNALHWIPLVTLAATACHTAPSATGDASRHSSIDAAAEGTIEVVSIADVEWGPLNPARGDKGPKAATLWGDRTAPGPTGLLVEFLDGFSSPPHIHNVSYRGVVISGLVHNDDSGAGEMWMPAGSYWTQPKGAEHITAASGARNLAYIEIDDGPYLVHAVEEQFETDEVPINVDASNLVWIDPPAGAAAAGGVRVAHLWGEVREGGRNGMFVKLPAGVSAVVRGGGTTLRAIVVAGRPGVRGARGADDAALESGSVLEPGRALEPGSAITATGTPALAIEGDPRAESLLYVHAEGVVDVVAAH